MTKTTASLSVLTFVLATTLGQTAGAQSASAGDSAIAVRQDAKLGPILTGKDGLTLYLYTKDKPGVSNCDDQCLVAWPPLLADTLPALPRGTPGTLSLVARKDGTRQVAYNGWPLYYWVRDNKAGETTGQAVGKVWYVVNPGPALQTTSAGKLGTVLTGWNDMTLYMYTKDKPYVSTCYDQCAAAWPPVLVGYTPTAAAGLKGKLGTTTRKDGSRQLTYNGMPLYSWVKDKAPGDTTGQDVGKVWYVVNP